HVHRRHLHPFPTRRSSDLFAYSLLEQFNLPLKRRMKKLSRGMLSAVGIIVGLASRAPLTIFDEPYLGLDAVSRELFYNKLLEDRSEEHTSELQSRFDLVCR